MRDYALPSYDAGVLVAEQATADFYETVAAGRDPKLAANWVMGDFFAALNRTGRGIADSPVTAADLGKLLDLMADGTINGRIGKEVFEAMVETGQDPPASSTREDCARSPIPARSTRRWSGCWWRMPRRWRSTGRARTNCSAFSSAR